MSRTKRVYIVDGQASVRKALTGLLTGLAYEVRSFASAAAFVSDACIDTPCCLLLDVSMTDQTGFALQRHLTQKEAIVPIIFMTGDGDIAMGVRAMKAGAVDFLTKPLHPRDLLPAVELALANSREWHGIQVKQLQARALFSRLTPREREVLGLVLKGKRNKQIADALESREATVKVHRSRLMQKLEARTLAELLHLGQQLDLTRSVASSRRRADTLGSEAAAFNGGWPKWSPPATHRPAVAPMDRPRQGAGAGGAGDSHATANAEFPWMTG